MKKILLSANIILFSLLITNCSSDSNSVNEEIASTPNNTETMFAKLNIKWNQSYSWKEYKINGSANTPYAASGNVGQITFIKPNIIKETYNGNTYQTTFSTSNFSENQCSLITPDWHNKPTSPYINNVESISKENNEVVWSYCFASGGVYNCTKLSFTP
jgi:hypothetical protein